MRAPAAAVRRALLVPLFAAWCCHAQAAPPLPPSIAAQLPAGYQPFVAQPGPALGDGRRTLLVVVHRATNDGPDDGVESGTVAATGENSDSTGFHSGLGLRSEGPDLARAPC